MKTKIMSVCLLCSIVFVLGGLSLQAGEKGWNPPKLEQEGGWTLVVFPDPQQYTSQQNFPILEMMMNWLVDNKANLNIQQIVCMGDMVNQNRNSKQWNYSSRAFAMLDGVYPYALCTGNHDYGGPKATADSRETSFNLFYPSDRNPAWKGVLVTMGKNTFGQETLENAVYETALPNGKLFVVISIPFAPTDESLAWAKNIADQKKYDSALVAVITHDYMLPDARKNALDETKSYKLQKEGGASGQEIWDKLLFRSKNIRMLFCGHHAGNDNHQDCTGFRVDKNAAGKPVYQMVYDAQAMGGGFGGNGGDGWLRLVEFSKDMKPVKVTTFSPLYAISPSTRHMAWERAPYNQFEFDIAY
ncbi:MAG: metallophosphoesterase [Thermoguttaceae bacterium]|nr:metallophosphoesterase [Thermoguttaceae bacterium]